MRKSTILDKLSDDDFKAVEAMVEDRIRIGKPGYVVYVSNDWLRRYKVKSIAKLGCAFSVGALFVAVGLIVYEKIQENNKNKEKKA